MGCLRQDTSRGQLQKEKASIPEYTQLLSSRSKPGRRETIADSSQKGEIELLEHEEQCIS
jgi:hypothetical protein